MTTLPYDKITDRDQYHLYFYAQHACSTVKGVHQTFLLTQMALKVQGCLVECGVAAGAMVGTMAYACAQAADARIIHLFDSFDGIPMAGPKDDSQPGLNDFIMDRNAPLAERLVSSGISKCSQATVLKLLTDTWHFHAEQFVFHPGWFQNTLPSVCLPPIAFLRLDGDLYESTQCCLKWLYSSVARGGIVLLDDYALTGSRKALEEFFAEHELPLPEINVDSDYGAGWWIKA
jgi:hypothetical protein